MKKIMLVLLVLCISAVAFADPALGYWKSINEEGKITAGWEIYVENGKLYGKIVKVADQPADALAEECTGEYEDFPVAGDVSKMPLVGTPFIYGLEMKKEGEWRKGSIIDPESGKLYGCQITFHKAGSKKFATDTLEMRGKIGPFGRSQFWQRSSLEEIQSL